MGEVDEYMSVFPEDDKMLEPYVDLLAFTMDQINKEFNEIYMIVNQKDFALEALKTPFSGLMFQMRQKRNLTAHDVFFQLNEKAQHSILEKFV